MTSHSHPSDREDLIGAGISPRERLERIEKVLDRIDMKLDGKADAAVVVALEVRLALLERSVAEHHAAAEERRTRDDRVQEAVDELNEGQRAIERRVAYAAGVAAILAVLGEALFQRFVG